MWPRRRSREREGATATLAAEPQPSPHGLEELRAEIQRLSGASGDLETRRRLLRARHLAGICIVDDARENPRFAEPGAAGLPTGDPLLEIPSGSLTPELLRAGILRDGCVLIRGLIPRADAEYLAGEIDRAYAERTRYGEGGLVVDGYYEEFQPHPRFGAVQGRAWIEGGGGLLAADSPRLCAEMMDRFEAAGIPELVSGYLGEPAAISVQKTTLRKAEPAVPGAWHQDGSFMGPVRALNLWLAASRCGDEAPGLDIVPRRLDSYVATGTEGAKLSWTISDEVAREAAGARGVIRPIFEPGDALLFDELFLHKTGSDPRMPKPRFAIERWFFGASRFPAEYVPIAV